MPALKAAGWSDFVAVTSSGGLSARHLAERHGFGLALPDADDMAQQEAVAVAFVLSRHDSHAALTAKLLRAGKHVFVEKPLALSQEELDDVLDAYATSGKQLWVGFNRRHSEAVQKTVAALSGSVGPIVATYRVSAGRLPESHWYKDRRQGGRLLGEVCHFVDTISWIVGTPPTSVLAMGSGVGEVLLQEDLVVSLRYPDGSVASVTYAQDGHGSTSKERLEILGRGHSFVINDFRSLEVDGKEVKLSKPDKGHVENLTRFRQVLLGEMDGFADLQASLDTTRTMLAAGRSLATRFPEFIQCTKINISRTTDM
jgi:predicted dehydrogenase